MSPEYLQYGTISEKLDVYAFGVVLLSLLTGLPVRDAARQRPWLSEHAQAAIDALQDDANNLDGMAALYDGAVVHPPGRPAADAVACLLVRCLELRPGRRPVMVGDDRAVLPCLAAAQAMLPVEHNDTRPSLCVFCEVALAQTILAPCGHKVLCAACAKMMERARELQQCPMCRAAVLCRFDKIFTTY